MIALQDDFNQNEVGKKKTTIRPNSKMQTLLQRLIRGHKKRKQRRADRVALYRLLHLDDALLKDIGITRSDINAVRSGALSMDAIIKSEITSTRDQAGYYQPKKGSAP